MAGGGWRVEVGRVEVGRVGTRVVYDREEEKGCSRKIKGAHECERSMYGYGESEGDKQWKG